jgi:soluble lytic murein transglycosylase-like protein
MFLTIIAKYCLIPVSMVLSVIQVESTGNPLALSQGNYGLMQVRLATAKELNCGVKTTADLFKPDVNINCGCNYLSKQYKRYGNWKAAVVAYNQGSVISDGKIILNRKNLDKRAMETVNQNVYMKKVFKQFDKICLANRDCGL